MTGISQSSNAHPKGEEEEEERNIQSENEKSNVLPNEIPK
jgi:hypothetical protein